MLGANNGLRRVKYVNLQYKQDAYCYALNYYWEVLPGSSECYQWIQKFYFSSLYSLVLLYPCIETATRTWYMRKTFGSDVLDYFIGIPFLIPSDASVVRLYQINVSSYSTFAYKWRIYVLTIKHMSHTSRRLLLKLFASWPFQLLMSRFHTREGEDALMIVTSMAQGTSVTQLSMQLATLNAGNWYQLLLGPSGSPPLISDRCV